MTFAARATPCLHLRVRQSWTSSSGRFPSINPRHCAARSDGARRLHWNDCQSSANGLNSFVMNFACFDSRRNRADNSAMLAGRKIVVVMPAYNAAKTLLQTHQEVMDQGIVDL